jgi:hypothetical protein
MLDIDEYLGLRLSSDQIFDFDQILLSINVADLYKINVLPDYKTRLTISNDLSMMPISCFVRTLVRWPGTGLPVTGMTFCSEFDSRFISIVEKLLR